MPFQTLLFQVVVGITGLILAEAATGQSDWAKFESGDDLVVTTTTGQTLRGQLSGASTAHELCLVSTTEGVVLESRTPVGSVARVERGRVVSVPPLWNAANYQSNELVPRDSALPTTSTEAPTADRVQALEVFAVPVNWDADADVDGLRVWVVPRSSQTQVLAIAGSLQAELLVDNGAEVPNRRRFISRERWSRELTHTEFSPDGAVVELPFRHVESTGELAVPPLGVLKVRYVVAGQGAFDAIVPDVVLSSYSWNRDQQQLLTGQRKFPGERHTPQR